MMLLKRAAVAALLMLAPQTTRADVMLAETTRSMATAMGEASGYFESCRPDLDRSVFRKANVLEDLDSLFGEEGMRVLSAAYDLGHLQGQATACSQKTAELLASRVKLALEDWGKAL